MTMQNHIKTCGGRGRIILRTLLIGVLALILTAGCGVYFNTMFNANKAFNKAEETRKNSRTGRGGQSDYQRAIDKARKVVENHPNSKYYDDALYIMAVSYFHTDQFARAERRFRELLANYGDSKFARESQLYLAKAKLELNEVDEAMTMFEDVFNQDYQREFKAEAAMGLGEYYYDRLEYDRSRGYFMSVRDSLGNDLQKLQAQIYIADGYFESFQFDDALDAYLQVLGLDPDKDQTYHALFSAAKSSYRLLQIDDGQAYLRRLAEDELYYDSLGSINLKIAEGYEYEDDLLLAESIYQEVAESGERKRDQAQAYYRLGLIYQFDYDELEEAKSYYDKAIELGRGTDFVNDALQRSSDIGKLSQYRVDITIDSTTTQQQIDEAAYTQYLLAELYWFKLNKPDTAMMEMQLIVDSFPTSYDAPKAMIAVADMYRDHRADTAAADSILREMLQKYPHSDFVPEAISMLGLDGTAADTGYAEYYFEQGERWVIEEQNYDSAAYYFQQVVDRFPGSSYYMHARFNLIYLQELYSLPGDSSVVLAYQAYIDSFPASDFADDARARLGMAVQRQQQPARRADDEELLEARRGELEEGQPGQQGAEQDTVTGYIDPRETLYIGPDGDTLADFTEEPIEIEEPFEFPTEAYNAQEDDFFLYFQILVDFSGEVVDVVLKIPSPYPEVNTRATETVRSMVFDPLKVSQVVSRFNLQESPDGRGHWLVYKYLVSKPDFLR